MRLCCPVTSVRVSNAAILINGPHLSDYVQVCEHTTAGANADK